MANAFMCSVEEKLACENKLPSFYKRYVDDMLALVRDLSDATDLLACLNEAHPSIQFTMEIATNDRLPFIGMENIKIDASLETCIYRKKTNKGLLLHYQSYVDSRYKRSLLRTIGTLSIDNEIHDDDFHNPKSIGSRVSFSAGKTKVKQRVV